jgi:hypothetical protein
MIEIVLSKLELCLGGRLYAKQRLGIETDHEAQIFITAVGVIARGLASFHTGPRRQCYGCDIRCKRGAGGSSPGGALHSSIFALAAGKLLFKQGIRQLEALMFVGAGIKQHQRTGAETFEPTDIVFAKPAPLVQSARVSEGMSPACSIDVELNCLLAERTLCEKRVKSPPNQQLYELHSPYR